MDIYTITYGVLTAIGGIIGYVKAGSHASLVSGVGSGALILIGERLAAKDPKNVYLLLAVSGLLTYVMGSKFAAGGKFMPAGLVTMMSVAVFVKYILRLM